MHINVSGMLSSYFNSNFKISILNQHCVPIILLHETTETLSLTAGNADQTKRNYMNSIKTRKSLNAGKYSYSLNSILIWINLSAATVGFTASRLGDVLEMATADVLCYCW